ncbi:hypothetical protein E2320_022632 [Naja naja]|nr:hypothetical protein E2320_022632 [Naja naja]
MPQSHHVSPRHAFRQRTQAENESVSEYVAALRSAALHCGFRDQLDDMLLDQLVCGSETYVYKEDYWLRQTSP